VFGAGAAIVTDVAPDIEHDQYHHCDDNHAI
jgi:hypothetical protein